MSGVTTSPVDSFIHLIRDLRGFQRLNLMIAESLLVMRSLGLQTTTTFVTGRRVSKFINKEFIEDVVISEAISVQSVIFYLAILLRKVDSNTPCLIPLFHVRFYLLIVWTLASKHFKCTTSQSSVTTSTHSQICFLFSGESYLDKLSSCECLRNQ